MSGAFDPYGPYGTLTAAEFAAIEEAVLTRREALWAECVAQHAELDRCQAEYYRVHDARLKAAARERAAARKRGTSDAPG